MSVSRVLLRLSKSFPRSSRGLLSPAQTHPGRILSNQFHNVVFDARNKSVTSDLSLTNQSVLHSTLQRFGISSSTFSEASAREGGAKEAGNDEKTFEDAKVSNQPEDLSTGGTKVLDEKETSDSEENEDLSMNDLVKLVVEKEELLKAKHKEIEKMQDKVLRTYAEMENVMERTRREAENAKKFAIQNFAKALLDVADNLGRASTVVKDSLAKTDSSEDQSAAMPLLKTLLEGVEMTEKQLSEVFRKFGAEKFDPTNEPFDPHRHNAVFQMPDSSKPPGTVAVVLKPGYMLFDRVLRPAEVGVTQEVEGGTEDSTADKSSEV